VLYALWGEALIELGSVERLHLRGGEGWDEFAREHPTILGTLLDAISGALAKADSVELARLPRMADFAIWTTAAEEALGWEAGTFMAAYDESREETVAEALESDLVAGAVLSLMSDRKEWIGKSAELLEELGDEVDVMAEASRAWPKTPSHLSSRLKRLAPALRAQGIGYEDWREAGGARERKKRLWWQRNPPPAPSDDNDAGTVRDGAGTAPGRSDSEGHPAQESHRDADHQQEGRHGTARDDAPQPRSGGTSATGDDPETTAQQQTSANLSETGDGEHAEAARYPSPQSGGAEDRPMPSLPSRQCTLHSGLVASADIPALVEEIEAAEVVGLDLETTGLDPRRHRIRLLSAATARGAWVVDLFAEDSESVLAALKQKPLVIHNAAFDLGFLHDLGYEHEGKVIDTMIMSQLLHAGADLPPLKGNRSSHALDAVCQRELGIELDKSHQKDEWEGELTPDMVDYAARDAEVLVPLHRRLLEEIENANLSHVAEIERRALPAISWMAHSGLPFDEARWLELAEEAKRETALLSARLQKMVPPHPDGKEWNFNSAKQVKQVLSMLGLPVEDARDETLARHNHELVHLLRAYRKKSGVATRQGKNWLRSEEGSERVIEGRVHPKWRQIGAVTGRMACAEPNLQAIPHGSGHHSCIRAPEGRVLIKADYSQIELRLAAKLWGESVMLETFREGGDIHLTAARSLTGKKDVTTEERKLAKAVNFGLIFGQGADGLRQHARNNYGVDMTPEEAAAYRKRFFRTYRAIRRWHKADKARLRRKEFDTRTLTGRRRQDVRSPTEHLNAPVQGTAADGMKMALALLWERHAECSSAVPVLAVHDEIVIECDADRAEEAKTWLMKAMEDGMDTIVNREEPRVPIEVEASISEAWGD
jgi:DNA polymerase-1